MRPARGRGARDHVESRDHGARGYVDRITCEAVSCAILKTPCVIGKYARKRARCLFFERFLRLRFSVLFPISC